MKKIISLSLAFSMFISITASALITETYKVTHEIGYQTTFTQIAGLNGSSPQQVNIIEYSPSTKVSPVVVYNDKVYNSKLSITQARDLLENEKVIAGVNGDFYSVSTGVPIGIMIVDGEMVTCDGYNYALGFNENNEAFIGKPSVEFKLVYEDGYARIAYYNRVRTTEGIYLLDENFHSNTLSNKSGYDIILEELDDSPITANGSKQLKVIDIKYTSSPTDLIEGQMVLTLREEIADWLPNVSVGEIVTLQTSTSDTRWQDTQYAIGGYQLLIKDGVIEPNLATSVDPRTAVGVKADGSLVVYQVDGRQQGYSTGLSLNDVAKELLEMGCVDALNLDGGGSSSTIANLPGYDTATQQSSPSDGSLRSNSNYLMFVNNQYEIGSLSNLHIYTDKELMLVGGSINIDVKGTDQNYYPVDDNFYLKLSVDGTVLENNYFTATKTGQSTITAFNNTLISNTKNITVLSKVSNINVSNSSGENITSLVTKAGTSTQLNVSAVHNYIPVASSNTSFDYKVYGNIGVIDENGLFTANDTQATGKIIISYLDDSQTEITVSVGLEKEEDLLNVDASQFVSYDSELEHYDVANKIIPQTGVRVTSETDANLTLSPINITNYNHINVTTTGDYDKAFAIFLDTSSQKSLVSLYTQDNSNVATAVIPSNAESFLGFSVQNGTTSTFENISFSTSANNLVVPSLDLTSSNLESVNSVSITGKITSNGYALDKNNISFILNGENQSFTYDEFSGEVSANISSLKEGLNNLKVTTTDNFGNLTIKNFDITSMISSQNIFVDTDNNWAKEYINYNQYYSVVNGTIIDDETYFNPTQSISREEFAVMMYRFLGLELPNSYKMFEDDSEIASWAKEAVYAMSAHGLMNGSQNSNGTYNFSPNNTITRAEVFTVLSRIIPSGNILLDTNFTDSDLIPSWSEDSIKLLNTFNIVSGFTDNTIKPLENITRAEVCKLLYSIK